MPDEAGGGHKITKQGVVIKKRLNREHPEHIAVIFDIRSDNEQAMRLSIRDPVPEKYPVGFHPDFGGHHWSITDDGVSFERVIEPGESFKTVYGVGNVSSSEVDKLATAPTIEISTEIGVKASKDLVRETDSDVDDASGDNFGELDLGVSIDREDTGREEIFLEDLADEVAETPDEGGRSEPAPLEGMRGSSKTVRITGPRVVIEKSLDQDRFSFPSIVFDVTITGEDPVHVRIEDRLPESLSMESIGFHHRYGDEFWEELDQSVAFERTFEPGEEFTTLYAIRDLGSTDEQAMLEEPAVTIWHQPATPDGPGERIDRQSDEEDSETASATDEKGAGPDGQAAEPEEPGPGEFDRSNSVDSISHFSEGVEEAVETNSWAEQPSDEDESMLAELFETDPTAPTQDLLSQSAEGSPAPGTEKRAQETDSTSNVSPEEVDDGSQGERDAHRRPSAVLAGEISPNRWVSGTVKRTIEQLEARVTELTESIATKETEPEELRNEIGKLRSELDELSASIETVEDQSSSATETLDDLNSRVRALENSIPEEQESAATDLSELHSSVADLAEEVSLIKSALASDLETSYQIRTQLEETQAAVEETTKVAESTADRSSSIETALNDIQPLVEANAQRLDELQSKEDSLGPAVHDMNDQLTTIADHMKDIQATLAEYGDGMESLKNAMIADLSVRNPSELSELPVAERELLQDTDSIPLTIINGIGLARANTLQAELGVSDLVDLADIQAERVASVIDVSLEVARRFVETARAIATLQAD